MSPHAPYTVSGQLYQEVSRRADEYDFPVALHLTESADEYQLIRHGGGRLARGLMALAGWSCLSWQPSGVSPVKYLEQWGILGKRVLAAHCIYVDDSDLEILHKYDVAIAHCPRSNAQLGNGIAPLTEFHQRGLRVGLGTDSLASNYSLDMFDDENNNLNHNGFPFLFSERSRFLGFRFGHYPSTPFIPNLQKFLSIHYPVELWSTSAEPGLLFLQFHPRQSLSTALFPSQSGHLS
ncbi:amidohydrolase family protein [Candidatus Hakubella thermalkaliphila]|uniref:amidohydrolase family protein n=1 Tax=Candidatus Hakubella thermalkaliphila TaxID=2754717 RepID=UPI00387EA69E